MSNKNDSENDSPAQKMRKLMNLAEICLMPFIDELYVTRSNKTLRLLEGKWVTGRFDQNIRIDQPNYGAGMTHAHIHGRKGNEIGIVNIDGTPSHGTKCRLHNADIEALQARGFNVSESGIVEWISLKIPTIRFLTEG